MAELSKKSIVQKYRLLTKCLLQVLFFTAFYLVAVSQAEKISGDNVCWPSSWPSAVSNLTVDPDLLQGELANGFRYVLKQNQEPKNRVAVFLYVKAGSLNEANDEQGLAHFLEHMMFKGTDNFPAGNLVEYFQSIGMNFGDDANAHTTFNQTVYNLILPNGSEQELHAGFSVMADYARRATLQYEQIERERGVILAEKRARDSASYRTQVASMQFAFRGTKLAERMVIGDEDILSQADRPALKSFYDRWYRPENMILVVVGDMDVKIAEQLVEKHFSLLSPLGSKPECPQFGELKHRGTEFFYHFEPELGKTNVSIESIWNMKLQDDSLQLEAQEILRSMGEMIMGYRLQRLQEEKNSPFTRATYSSGDIIERIGYGTISAQTEGGRWQEVLSLLDGTLRQAIQYGFSDQEVERIKKEIISDLDSRVLTAKSEDSRMIAQKILRHLASNRVYQSAEQEKIIYGPIVEHITTNQVNREFQAVWNHDSRMVSVTGDAQLGEEGNSIIATDYQRAVQNHVVVPQSIQNDTFPYLPLSNHPNETPDFRYFKDIDVEKLIFANGLVINLKKTDYQNNSVQVMADFGFGQQSEPSPGMAMLTEDIINSSGAGRLPQSAIDALVAGSSVNLRFHIGEAAFSWVGSSLSKDFELLIQMLHTLLYDQGFRENQFANIMNKAEMMYQRISHEIDGAMALHVLPFLANGNPHFGLPPWKNISELQYPELAKWARSFSQPKDLELSVVGDFKRDEIINILEKYFGGVTLQSSRIPEPVVVHFPDGETLQVKIKTSIDKSLIVVAWPTEDFWDINRTRRLHLLASVFEDRVRKVIREKMGAAYSPAVSNFSSRSYQGFGYLIAQMIVKPGDEEAIIKEIFAIAEWLKEDGVSTNELVRARKPMVTSITDKIRTNQYWLSSVLALSSRYPQQLEWPRTILEDYASIDEEDLNRLARQYLGKSRAAIAKIFPNAELNQAAARNAIGIKKADDADW